MVETRVLRARPERVWAVVGDFGNEHRWVSTLAHCRRSTTDVRVGTVRSCRLERPLMGRSSVDEELTDYQPGVMLAYRLLGAAGPFRSSEGRWWLRPGRDGTTAVEVAGRFTPRNVVIGFLFGRFARLVARRAARHTLDDLAAAVEAVT